MKTLTLVALLVLLVILKVEAYPEIGFTSKLTTSVQRGQGWMKISGWKTSVKPREGFYNFDASLSQEQDVLITVSGFYFVCVSIPGSNMGTGRYQAALLIDNYTDVNQVGLLSEVMNSDSPNNTLTFCGVISLRASEFVSVFTYSDNDPDWIVTSKATFSFHYFGKVGSTPGFLGQLNGIRSLSAPNTIDVLQRWQITARAKLFKSKTGFSPYVGTFTAICAGLHLVMANIIIEAPAGTHMLTVMLDGNHTYTATVTTTKQSKVTLNVYKIYSLVADAVVQLGVQSTASGVMVQRESSWSMAYTGETSSIFREFSNTLLTDTHVTSSNWDPVQGLLSKRSGNGQFFEPPGLIVHDNTNFAAQDRPDLYYAMVNLHISGNATQVEAMLAVNAPVTPVGDEGVYTLLTKSANANGSVSLGVIFHLLKQQHISVRVRSLDGQSFTVLKSSTISIVRTRYIVSSFMARISQGRVIQATGWRELVGPWGEDSTGLYSFGKDFNTVTGRFTASHTGVHIVAVVVKFQNADPSTISLKVAINGNLNQKEGLFATNGDASSLTTLQIYGSVLLRAGQYLSVYHSSATDNDYSIASDSSFTVTYIGPTWSIPGFHALYNSTRVFQTTGTTFELTDWLTTKSGVSSAFSTGNYLQNGRFTAPVSAVYLVSANILVRNISQSTQSSYEVQLAVGGVLSPTVCKSVTPTFATSTAPRDFITLSLVAPIQVQAGQYVSVFFKSNNDAYYVLDEASDFSVIRWSRATSPPDLGVFVASTSDIGLNNNQNQVTGLNTPATTSNGLFVIGQGYSTTVSINDFGPEEAGIFFVTGMFIIGQGAAARFEMRAEIDQQSIPLKTIEVSPRGNAYTLSVGGTVYLTVGQRIRVIVVGNKAAYDIMAGSNFGLIQLRPDDTDPGFTVDKETTTPYTVTGSRDINNWDIASKPGIHVSNTGLSVVDGSYSSSVSGIYISTFNIILRGASSSLVDAAFYNPSNQQQYLKGLSSFGTTRTVLSSRAVYLNNNARLLLQLNSSVTFNSSTFAAGSSSYFYDKQERVVGFSSDKENDFALTPTWASVSGWKSGIATYGSSLTATEYTVTTPGVYIVTFSAILRSVNGEVSVAVFTDNDQSITGTFKGVASSHGLPISGALNLVAGKKVSFKVKSAVMNTTLTSDSTRSLTLISHVNGNTDGVSAVIPTSINLASGMVVISNWATSHNVSFQNSVTLESNGLLIVTRSGVYYVAINAIIENRLNASTFVVYAKVDSETVSPNNLRVEQVIQENGISTLLIASNIYLQRFSSLRILISRPDNMTYTLRNGSTFSVILIDDNTGPSLCDDFGLHVQKFVNTFRRISIRKSISLKCNVLGTYPVSYKWFKDNSLLANETRDTFTISSTTLRDSGNYHCRVEYRTLSDTTNNVTVQVYDPTPTLVPLGPYTITIAENAPLGNPVTIFSVKGEYMFGTDATIKVYITNGDPQGNFNLTGASKTNATLMVAKPLDSDTTNFYQITFTAVNMDEPGSMNSSIQFNITVTDVNDNAPVFSQQSYSVSIQENMPLGTSVVMVTATDKDSGSNAIVKYSLVGNNTLSVFQVNESTGLVTSKASLDREMKSYYVIFVKATDMRFTSVAEVRIIVTDVNDNSPAFEPVTYNTAILETTPVMASVIQVYAKDIDAGMNATIRYRFVSPANTPFSIDASTGIIRLISPLNFENTTSYNLTIMATDQGQPQMMTRSHARVMVSVLDVNDNAAMFSMSKFMLFVPEDQPINSSLVNVSATDMDGTERNRMLIYQLRGTVANTYLRIDPHTGRISNKRFFDFEQDKHVFGTIVATDNGTVPISRFASLAIYIQNVNDVAPRFLRISYSAAVSESTKIGVPISALNATDMDGDQLRYFVTNSACPVMVNNADGEVVLKCTLDRETQSTHVVNFTVGDGKHNATIEAMLTITVLDSNDNAPVFLPQTQVINITESTPVGSSLFNCTATDRDLGSNAMITYSILNPVSQSFPFNISNTTGVVYLTQTLDFEVANQYTLHIKARDHGTPYQETVKTLTINVLDANDNSPTFEKNMYHITVSELVEVDTSVIQVRASDPETKTLQYSIVKGNEENKFRISSDGSVMVNGRLDYETVTNYTLTIQATDGMRVSLTNATVIVEVIEQNDNFPIFSRRYTKVNIFENVAIGTPVIQMTAQDADRGKMQSTVRYSLENTTTFTINEITGNITVTGNIDYEGQQTYSLVVIATDMGQPPLQSRALLDIFVMDRNDNPPVFEKTVYSITIPELTPLSTLFIRLRATDKDSGPRGEIIYKIADPGDAGNAFTLISNSGYIHPAQLLDFETKSMYTFTCLAEDKGTPPMRSAINVTVIVNITDNNDNEPVFSMSSYEQNIREDFPVGGLIFRVNATDQDASPQFRTLTYSIVPSRDSGNFSVNDTGFVTSRAAFDYESITFYSFEVQANDAMTQALKGRARVTVTIMDVNDNSPVPQQTSYVVNVTEGTLIATQVLKIDASDKDANNNGKVVYMIKSSDPAGDFSIGRDDGVLRTIAKLNAATRSKYEIKVMVNDSGNPSRSAMVNVTVYVLSASIEGLQFVETTLQLPVIENTMPNNIGKVEATDTGNYTSHSIRYSIQSCSVSPQGILHLNAITGVFSLNRTLNYEVEKTIDCSVTARNERGAVAYCHATINVIDVNEKPFFLHTASDGKYYFNVSESVPINSCVFAVSASDNDTGANGQLTYALSLPNNLRGLFDINQEGKICIRQKLDIETSPSYVIQVTVTDGGSMVTTTDIFIQVLDINDIAPAFVPSGQIFLSVNENTPIGNEVKVVVATDGDRTSPNNLIRFEIHPSKPLSILNNGSIKVGASLDYEQGQRLFFVVTAYDMGSPRLENSTTLVLDIVNLNDEVPYFNVSFRNISVPESIHVGTYITTITAQDNDLGTFGKIANYTLLSANDTFEINNEGSIHLKRTLNARVRNTYVIDVMATDGGGRSSVTSARVQVNVIYQSQGQPIFLRSTTYASIPENFLIRNTVLTVPATSNEVIFGPLIYSLVPNNDSANFVIDNRTGAINSTQMFDYERQKMYTLQVEVRDSHNGKTGRALVVLSITDINDNTPVISAVSPVNVSETTFNGMVVSSVSASDRDSGSNGKISFALIGGNGLSNFAINTDGRIILTNSVSASTQPRYNLTIEARDSGTPSRSSTETIDIYIIAADTSRKNVPVFNTRSYIGYVNESVTVPFVLRVTANETNPISGSFLNYALTGANEEISSFRVNSTTGIISVVTRLDYEVKKRYDFIACATNKELFRDCVPVTIFVLDVNDNGPRFDPMVYNNTISESTPTGFPVIQLRISDADSASVNCAVRYNLTSGNEMGYFTVTSSGLVVINRMVDYDILASKTITLTAAVWEQCLPFVSTATIYVRVVDENDEHPLFSAMQYNMTVYENATMGTLLGYIMATDRDAVSPNKDIVYSLVTETSFNATTEGNRGAVRVTGKLDYETTKMYWLVAEARDKGTPTLSSTAMLHITVLDVNDEVPVLSESMYNNSVSEGTGKDTVIIRVHATDKDTGSCGQVSYSLTDRTNTFSVDRMGAIRAIKKLDYESVTGYNFEVVAADGCGMKASAPVVITVVDINDNQPVFTLGRYEFYVSENATSMTIVGRVSAADSDRVRNTVMYHIRRNAESENFMISSSGDITLINATLDFEVQNRFVFQVEASDSGSPNLNGSTQVVIHVLDENDNAPVITPRYVRINVTESIKVGTIVTSFSVVDKDSSKNGQIEWSITSGDSSSSFRVVKGNIMTTRALSASMTYNLTVQAKDMGSPSMASTAIVTITVLPRSINRPNFLQKVFEVRVSENVPPGQIILHLNFQSTTPYTLSLLPDSTFFAVNNDTRNVTIKSALDYEKNNRHYLTARVTNAAGISDYATILVIVQNVNDNDPYFSLPVYIMNISESVFIGHLILRLDPRDNDTTSGESLTVNLLNGNDTFMLRGNDLLVRTKPFQQKVYRLNVSVSDRDGRRGYTMVIVNIEPENPPKFTNSTYIVDVYENVTVGTTILTVSAGLPTRGIRYTTRSGAGVFDLNSATGAITTKITLNYENTKQYILTVMARVTTPIPMATAATVVVNVLNVHDLQPKFRLSRYTVNVAERHPMDSTVITLEVINIDVQESNLRYRIISGNTGDAFKTSNNGDILLKNALRFNETRRYNLTVEVFDGRFTATTTVDVNVLETPKCPPTFESTFYYMKIPENTPRNQDILTVKIRGVTSGISFSLQGAESSAFTIDGLGKIKSNALFDFDMKRIYAFVARGVVSGFTVSTAVVVEITDVNNKAPLVYRTNYTRTIYESAPIGTQLVHINATKMDTVPNRLTYRILTGNENTIFDVDDMGSVKLQRQVDYEKAKKHSLTVEISDGINSVMSYITVNVLDIQETFTCEACPTQAPCPQCTTASRYHFTRPFYEAVVSESSKRGHLVTRVELSSAVARTFSIVESAMQQLFDIHPVNGQITLKAPLDYEKATNLYFTVKATGLPCLNLTTVVLIRVTNVNEHCPQPAQMSYTQILVQPIEVGTIVAAIEINDNDTVVGTSTHSLAITGDTQGLFSIDKQNNVRVSKRIVVSQNTSYHFMVTVSEGSCTSTANVTLHVRASTTGTCPGCPTVSSYQFNATLYEKSFPESTAVNTTLLTVRVSGRTPSAYSIREAKAREYFKIDKTSGTISLLKALDYEMNRAHRFTVQAQFSGFVTEAVVVINVSDKNDVCPDIAQSNIVAAHSYPIAQSAVLAVVAASDNDTVGMLAYSITGGDPTSLFNIDIRGAVTSRRQLTGVRSTSYNLVVRVTDGVCSKTANVQINAANPSSCPTVCPSANGYMFVRPSYPANIPENASVNSYILTVGLTNTTFTRSLSIAEANASAMFMIDSSSGNLTLRSALDYEKNKKHVFTVLASFSDGVQSTTTVIIYVQDINDNQLTAVATPANVQVTTGYRKGLTVSTIKVTDPDTNNMFRYRVASGAAGKFTIDANGALKTTSCLLTSESPYNVRVAVSDGVHSEVFVNVRVDVYTVDSSVGASACPQVVVNASCPFQAPSTYQFSEQLVRIPVREDVAVGTDLNTRLVLRNNFNNRMFSIKESNSVVSINQTGWIKLNMSLDYEKQKQHIVTAVAVINGNIRTFATIVIDVLDVDDTAPIILPLPGVISVSEGTNKGDTVTCISATDKDTSTQLQYQIVNGNPNNTFNITSDGKIIVNRKLDSEGTNEYNLTVQVSDGTRTTTRVVTVKVSGTNDNVPVFTMTSYSGSVAENATINTPVLTVKANDKDSGTIRYSIADPEARKLFKIDPLTGAVTVNSSLDFETTKNYRFTVTATDDGGFQTSVPVNIDVTNVNDNAPVFSPVTYSLSIHEFTAPETPIVTVTASDKDMDSLTYSITGGNTNNAFKIDPNSGVVMVQTSPYRFATRQYRLTVQAEDKDKKSATKVVTIRIVRTTSSQAGCNYFGNQASQTRDVFENATVGTTIFTPAGSGVTNRQLLYSIDNADARNTFNISETTGKVALKSPLDYEKQRSHLIVVKVTDPVTNITSYGFVMVDVKNVDDNQVSFPSAPYTKSVSEAAAPGTSVLQVQAVDPDPNTVIRYRIDDGNTGGLFLIDQSTGVITLNKSLDYETSKTHTLKVCARETTSGALTCTDVKINTANANDNAPVFDKRSFTGTVVPNTTVGTTIVSANASDADGGSLTYTLKGTRANEFFSVGTNGDINLRKKLDNSIKLPFTFDVCVTDSGPPTIEVCRPVSVGGTVGPQNLYAPKFAKAVYGAALTPSTALNNVVLEVVAKDNDTGVAGTVEYSIQSGDPQKFFSIDNDGKIKLMKPITSNTNVKLFTLQIKATDGGDPSKSTTVEALIGVVQSVASSDSRVVSVDGNTMLVNLSKSPFETSRVKHYHIICQRFNPNSGTLQSSFSIVGWFQANYIKILFGDHPYRTGFVEEKKRRRRSVQENNPQYILYRVGVETGCETKTSVTDICNGPLTAGEQYRFYLIAFYVDNVPVPSQWTQQSRAVTGTTTSAATGVISTTFTETYWIIGLIVLGILFFMAMVAIAVLLCYKRRMLLPHTPVTYTNPVYDEEDAVKRPVINIHEYNVHEEIGYQKEQTLRVTKEAGPEVEKGRETQQTSFVFVDAEDNTFLHVAPDYETISADLKFDQEPPEWHSMDIQLKIDPTGKLDPVISRKEPVDQDDHILETVRKVSDSSSSSDSVAKKSKQSSSPKSSSGSHPEDHPDEHDHSDSDHEVTPAVFTDPEDVTVTTFKEVDATTMTTITTVTTTTQGIPMRVYVDEEQEEDATQL